MTDKHACLPLITFLAAAIICLPGFTCNSGKASSQSITDWPLLLTDQHASTVHPGQILAINVRRTRYIRVMPRRAYAAVQWSGDHSRALLSVEGENRDKDHTINLSFFVSSYNPAMHKFSALVPMNQALASNGVVYSSTLNTYCASWSPDCKYLFYISDDDALKLLDLRMGTRKTILAATRAPGGEGWFLYNICWAKDGKQIAFTNDASTWIVDIKSAKLKWIHKGGILDWSQDGRYLLMIDHPVEGKMFRYDLKTGAIDKFSGTNMIDAGAFSSEGDKVVAFGDLHYNTGLYIFTADGHIIRRLFKAEQLPSLTINGTSFTAFCGEDFSW